MLQRHRAFLWALASLALVQLVLFLYYVKMTTVFGLFYDMADWLLAYARYLGDGDLVRYLWSPHYEHRLAITRLVLLADIKLFGGVSYPFVAVSLCCVVFVAVALLRSAHSGMPPRIPSCIVSFLIVIFIFNPAVGVACSVPIYDNYPHAIGLAAVALYFFDGEDTHGRGTPFRRALALFAAAGSALGSAVGLLIWPILLWAAWRGRLPGRWIAATVLCGGTYVALYVHGYSLSQFDVSLAHADIFLSVTHLRKIPEYFLLYMGLPWSHDSRFLLPGEILGGLLSLLILAVIVRRGIIGPPGGLRERVEVGLLIFVLGTAVLASLGRSDMVDLSGKIYAPIKYAIFLSVGHAALIATALPWVACWWELPQRRRALQLASLLLGGLLVAQQIGMGEAAAAKAAWVNASIARFMAGKRDDEMGRGIIHLAGGIADHALEFEQTARIYDFRP